jgi:hypothetical protein
MATAFLKSNCTQKCDYIALSCGFAFCYPHSYQLPEMNEWDSSRASSTFQSAWRGDKPPAQISNNAAV